MGFFFSVLALRISSVHYLHYDLVNMSVEMGDKMYLPLEGNDAPSLSKLLELYKCICGERSTSPGEVIRLLLAVENLSFL